MDQFYLYGHDDPKVQNALIKLLVELGIPVLDETAVQGYDPKYPILAWNGEHVTQSASFGSRRRVNSIPEFIQEVDKAVQSLPTRISLTKEYAADVYDDTVKVGCQTIPFEKVEEVYSIMLEKRKKKDS